MSDKLIKQLMLLSALGGASSNIAVVAAQAYYVAHFDPAYVIHYFLISGAILTVCFAYFKRVTNKFHEKGVWVPVAVTAVFILARSFHEFPLVFAGLWLLAAFLNSEIQKWFVAELAARYLNPVSASNFYSKSLTLYEMGSICAISLLYFFGGWFNPLTVLYVAIGINLLSIFLVVYRMRKQGTHEVRYSQKLPPSMIGDKKVRSALRWVVVTALFWGVFRYHHEVAVKISLKGFTADYVSLQKLFVIIYAVSGLLTVVGSIAMGKAMERYRVSPVLMQRIGLAINGVLLTACFVLPKLWVFVLMGAIGRACERTFFINANNTIFHSLERRLRSFIRARQHLFFIVFAGIIYVGVLEALASFSQSIQVTVTLVIAGIALMGAFIVSSALKLSLVSLMYRMVNSGNKVLAILGVNLLSYLKPKNFVSEMSFLLRQSPKKLLRKAIIIGLGYSRSSKASKIIIEQFSSDKEEIQIAVIDALSVSRNYEAMQFIVNVLISSITSRSVRVRVNAMSLIAMVYGKMAIPILLNGLQSNDNRAIANTLEVLTYFKDPQLAEIFVRYFNSPNPRVRANALMGISHIRRFRAIYQSQIFRMLTCGVAQEQASALYVIGRNTDRHLRPEVKKLAATSPKDSAIRRGIAWVFINFGEAKGETLFAKLFIEARDADDTENLLHLFSQLNLEQRFSVLEEVAGEIYGDRPSLKRISKDLKLSGFDFHAEIDFFNRYAHSFRPRKPIKFAA